jgi:AraC-like DNA-binding protein
MFEQQVLEHLLFVVGGAVAALSLVACCYLLFRRSNAFAPDVTSSVRLRRWTATFFAAVTLCHFWYIPTKFLTSPDDVRQAFFITGALDFMTVIPLPVVIMLVMLQDRRRPLWPVAALVAPLVVGLAWSAVSRSDDLRLVIYGYFLLLCIGLFIFMVRATKQYGRWLRDNYADLEDKEVWQGFAVMALVLLAYMTYLLDVGGIIFHYAMETVDIVLICYLLWRVETLSDLSIPAGETVEETVTTEILEDSDYPSSMHSNIDALLKQHCEETRIYLQHDLSLSQLAHVVGTNRYYLSQHFSSQGITYNTYINNLRIEYFMSLYREAAATSQPVTAQQLAHQCGFRNYNTFSTAFKKMMGTTVTEWMRNFKDITKDS